MDVFKTRVFFDELKEDSHLVDTIWHEGAWWLVGKWISVIATGERMPDVLVRLTGLPHHETTDPQYRFFLHIQLPKRALEGEKTDGFVVARHGMAPTPGSSSLH